jgi:hypothetical protein
MQMQINSPRLRRCDYAQWDLVALLPGDGNGSRPIREHGRGKRTFAPPTRCPRLLSTHDPPFRLAGQQLDHLRVQVGGIGMDRCVTE